MKDKNGNKIDISHMQMEKDLMRVVFDDTNLEWLDIYCEEKFSRRISLLE